MRRFVGIGLAIIMLLSISACGSKEPVTSDVDYDLTEMNGEMTYSIVYRMMTEPDTYVGKSFRMEGSYQPVHFEATGQDYHMCIVEDATACCAQGMEFEWASEPEEYPERDAYILVEGVYETYKEDGSDTLYCRLRDANVEVL